MSDQKILHDCKCGKKLRFSVSEGDRGTTKSIRCPNCKEVSEVQVPQASESPAQAQAQAAPSPMAKLPAVFNDPTAPLLSLEALMDPEFAERAGGYN